MMDQIRYEIAFLGNVLPLCLVNWVRSADSMITSLESIGI